MKPLSYLTVFVLLVSFAYGIVVDEGTLFNPSNTNITYNATVAFNATTIVVEADNLTIDSNFFNYTHPTAATWDLYKLTVLVENVVTNATITNYTVYAEDEQTLNVSNISTTTGSTIHILTNRTYTLFVETATDNKSALMVLNTTSEFLFYVWVNASTQITFRDEETTQIIDDRTVTIDFISDNFSDTRTTVTGTLDLSIPSLVDYTLRYSAPNYTERLHILELLNTSAQNLTLYLAENTTAEGVTITVLDETSDTVEGAIVQVLRYDVDSNTFLLVEEGTTNFEGETVVDLTLGTEFYKFMIWYDDELKKETASTYIYGTSLTIYINLQETVGERFFETESVTHNLSFLNGVNQFKLSFTDDDGNVEKACLKVTRMRGTGETIVNDTCLTNTTGNIFIGVDNSTGGTFKGVAQIYLEGESFFVDELIKTFYSAGQQTFGSLGVFLIILLTLAFAFVGIWDISVAMTLTPLPMLFGSAMGIISLNIGIAIGVEVLFIMLAVAVSRTKGT